MARRATYVGSDDPALSHSARNRASGRGAVRARPGRVGGPYLFGRIESSRTRMAGRKAGNLGASGENKTGGGGIRHPAKRQAKGDRRHLNTPTAKPTATRMAKARQNPG